MAGSLELNTVSALEDWSSSREPTPMLPSLYGRRAWCKTRPVGDDGGINAGKSGASDVHSRGHHVATVEDLFYHHPVQHNGVASGSLVKSGCLIGHQQIAGHRVPHRNRRPVFPVAPLKPVQWLSHHLHIDRHALIIFWAPHRRPRRHSVIVGLRVARQRLHNGQQASRRARRHLLFHVNHSCRSCDNHFCRSDICSM